MFFIIDGKMKEFLLRHICFGLELGEDVNKVSESHIKYVIWKV